MSIPSRAIALFGTEEEVPPPVVLRAGPLSAELDQGALRNIRLHGVEVLRGIAFLLRDESWATARPRIEGIQVEEDARGFRASYRARARLGEGTLAYAATIKGEAGGGLTFEVAGRAEGGIVTQRTGFVVLHPLEGVVDRPVRVTHGDGRVEETRFPRLISPAQPILDIRALAHEVFPGVWATCRMEAADVFEMEDQRNWTDASYKTYVRPLRLPRPYRVAAGEEVRQSVALGFSGEGRGPVSVGGERVEVRLGGPTGSVLPRIGLGLEAESIGAAEGVRALVARVRPAHLVAPFEPAAGHDAALLRRYRDFAAALGAEIVLELVLACSGPLEGELALAARLAGEAGLAPARIVVSPAVYRMSYQPDGAWPDCPPLEEVYAATRAAFPGVPVGGGMISYFTELNRKRPPVGAIDFVTHTTCPIVHDADDRSVMETLEALPWVIESTRAFAGDRPYHIGPSAIGMRHNPYGKAPVDNPANIRLAMARSDPRQRGLFAAAWNLGYIAACARGGIEALTLCAPTGPSGIVHGKGPHPQPWFDGLAGPAVHPLFHLLAGLAPVAGQPVREVEVSASARVAALAVGTGADTALWLANLGDTPQEVRIEGLNGGGLQVRRLDAAGFATAALDPDWSWRAGQAQPASEPVLLDAYATACILPAA